MENFDFVTGANYKKVSPWPTAIKWGLILGVAGIIIGLIMQMAGLVDYTGQKSNALSTVFNIIISATIMYFGIKEHKNKDLNGQMKLGRAIGFGSIAGLVWGLVTLVWTYIFFSYIDPTIIPQIMDATRESMESQGMDDDQIETAIEYSAAFLSPLSMGFYAMIASVFFGFILSLIIGLFVQTD